MCLTKLIKILNVFVKYLQLIRPGAELSSNQLTFILFFIYFIFFCVCVYVSPCVLKSLLQNQSIQTTTTSFSRQRNETLSMIHGSFPALFLSCTADRMEAFPASNMDLQCILCIVNSRSAVKTPKDEVTCNTCWDFYKKLKILTFPSKRDISRSNVRMGDNLS